VNPAPRLGIRRRSHGGTFKSLQRSMTIGDTFACGHGYVEAA
jgi:hypothetical protein